jgi:hypothetical protein
MRSPLFALSLVVAACGAPPALPVPSAVPPVMPATPVAVGIYDHRVEAADVSILYPIDTTTDRDALLSPQLIGDHGPLLGAHPPERGAADMYDDLRLVALRLDPCSARTGCASEVRVVWQPVVHVAETDVVDGAVHAAYAVPPDELQTMLKQILTLKQTYGKGVTYDVALGPQPLLVATGVDGPFARELREVIRAHVGADRVVRETFMTHENLEGDTWAFQRFDRQGDALTPTNIVGMSQSNTIVEGSSATLKDGGALYGGPEAVPSVPALLALVNGGRPAMATQPIHDAFTASLQVQDPRLHNSEDTDCVSCHLAEGAHRIGVTQYGLTDVDAFSSARSLEHVRTNPALTNFHAFGYLGTDVSIMQRTANESAIVADKMAAALAP